MLPPGGWRLEARPQVNRHQDVDRSRMTAYPSNIFPNDPANRLLITASTIQKR